MLPAPFPLQEQGLSPFLRYSPSTSLDRTWPQECRRAGVLYAEREHPGARFLRTEGGKTLIWYAALIHHWFFRGVSHTCPLDDWLPKMTTLWSYQTLDKLMDGEKTISLSGVSPINARNAQKKKIAVRKSHHNIGSRNQSMTFTEDKTQEYCCYRCKYFQERKEKTTESLRVKPDSERWRRKK